MRLAIYSSGMTIGYTSTKGYLTSDYWKYPLTVFFLASALLQIQKLHWRQTLSHQYKAFVLKGTSLLGVDSLQMPDVFLQFLSGFFCSFWQLICNWYCWLFDTLWLFQNFFSAFKLSKGDNSVRHPITSGPVNIQQAIVITNWLLTFILSFICYLNSSIRVSSFSCASLGMP